MLNLTQHIKHLVFTASLITLPSLGISNTQCTAPTSDNSCMLTEKTNLFELFKNTQPINTSKESNRYHTQIDSNKISSDLNDFKISLGEGENYIALMTHWSNNSQGHITWQADIYSSTNEFTDKVGSIAANITDLGMSGHFNIHETDFEISPLDPFNYLIKNVDDNEFQINDFHRAPFDDHTAETHNNPIDDGIEKQSNLTKVSTKSQSHLEVLDVMILYSKDILQDPDFNTISQVQAHAQQALSDANSLNQNSGINVAYTLVHFGPTPNDQPYFDPNAVPWYILPGPNDTWPIDTAVSQANQWLFNATDTGGSVRALQDQYGADIVALYIQGNGDFLCGRASLSVYQDKSESSIGIRDTFLNMHDINKRAYSAIEIGCPLYKNTLAHEIGHNFGMLHRAAEKNQEFELSPSGIGSSALEDGSEFHTTVMGCNLNNATPGTDAFNCQRVPFFSHDKTYLGKKLGDTDHNNVGLANTQASRLASYAIKNPIYSNINYPPRVYIDTSFLTQFRFSYQYPPSFSADITDESPISNNYIKWTVFPSSHPYPVYTSTYYGDQLNLTPASFKALGNRTYTIKLTVTDNNGNITIKSFHSYVSSNNIAIDGGIWTLSTNNDERLSIAKSTGNEWFTTWFKQNKVGNKNVPTWYISTNGTFTNNRLDVDLLDFENLNAQGQPTVLCNGQLKVTTQDIVSFSCGSATAVQQANLSVKSDGPSVYYAPSMQGWGLYDPKGHPRNRSQINSREVYLAAYNPQNKPRWFKVNTNSNFQNNVHSWSGTGIGFGFCTISNFNSCVNENFGYSNSFINIIPAIGSLPARMSFGLNFPNPSNSYTSGGYKYIYPLSTN